MLREVTESIEVYRSGQFRRWFVLLVLLAVAAGSGWGFVVALLIYGVR